MFLYKNLIFTTIALLFFSCKNEENATSEKILARVGDDFLYEKDLISDFPAQLKGVDSAKFVSGYVNDWIKKKVIYQKAERNIDENSYDINRKVIDFKEELFIHTYEQILVNLKLQETEITQDEIDTYYKNHKTEFILSDDIVLADFIQVSKKTEGIGKIMNWLKSNDSTQIDNLKDFCYQNANKFYFGTNWIIADELLRELPCQSKIETSFYKTQNIYNESDSLYNYYAKVHKFVTAGQAAPADYANSSIKSILIQKKRHEILKEIRSELYDDAVKKDDIENFTQPINE